MKPKTEQGNPKSRHIDKLSTLDMLALINQEDAKVALAVEKIIPDIARAVDKVAAALQNGGRLFYVGAGTSGRLGILDAVECVPTFSTPPDLVQGIIAGGSPALVQAVEGAEDNRTQAKNDLTARGLTRRDVVCGIAASGRTPYVIAALEYARSVQAKTIAICCNVSAPILDAAELGIGIDVGAEVIAGSTRMKSGTAQKMILNMLSAATMIKLGKVYGNLMVDLKVTNQKLAERACGLVMQLTGLDESAAKPLLAQADNQVKTAVVMQRREVSVGEARRLLAEAGGFLAAVIDERG